MKQLTKIILSGGGTGGHIYPAVAIANELKSRFPNAQFLFIGAKDRMEMEKIPQCGFKIKGLWISGLQRKLTFSNLLFPFKVINSVWNAFQIIRKFKPDVVIGTGGFASGPTLYVASLMRIPTLIQEQNSYPGITNKMLSKSADCICVAYNGLDKYFPPNKIVFTGNPVRQDLLQIDAKKTEAIQFFNLNPHKKTLLVLGGSLGARMINQIIAENLQFLLSQNIQIIWQTGKLYIDDYQKYGENMAVQTHAFINNMDFAYSVADFIISRSGAGSISELCIVGKPVLFIPSPNVAEDHQTKNAQSIVDQKAALMVKESAKEQFQPTIANLLNNIDLQKQLSQNIKKLALPNATSDIADWVEKIVNIK